MVFTGCGSGGGGITTQSDGGTDGGGDPVCGNGVMEGTEQCDDGNTDSGDGCDSECFNEGAICGDGMLEGREECEPGVDSGCHAAGHLSECTFVRTAFRMNSLGLFDPVIQLPQVCDPGFMDFVNDQLGGSATGDKFSSVAPPESLDGLIDLGFVFTFADPIQQGSGGENPASFVVSDCNAEFPAPVPNPSPCSPNTTEPSRSDFTATTQTGGATCLSAFDGTADRTVNAVVSGDDGCFASAPLDFSVILGTLLTIPLKETVIAGQWSGDPATGLVNGLIRGWLPRSVAETLIVPTLPFAGGGPLPDMVRVGTCTEYDDNDGEEGFWMYLTFEAEPVPWEGGALCGNGVIDVGGEGRDELCDPAIAPGSEGECGPLSDCDDGVSCTDDTLNAGDSCTPSCYHRAVGDNSDSCCALLADEIDGYLLPNGTRANPIVLATSDADCVDLCGDGTVQSWETCDTAGTGEDLCAVDPADQCGDDDVCTADEYHPSNPCICRNRALAPNGTGDGCCPASCNGANPPFACNSDPDCT